MKVGFFVPGWPPERYANGIVTAVGHVAPALRRLGLDVRILAVRGVAVPKEPWVTILPGKVAENLIMRVHRRLCWELNAERTTCRTAAELVERTVLGWRQAERLDVLEIEESLGWAYGIRRALDTPVVLTLHGPWLVHGPLSGESVASSPFRGRVRAEGQAIRDADLVLAPSQSVLRAAMTYYHSGHGRQHVLPYAMPLQPIDARWRANACNSNEFVFVGRFDSHKGGDLVVQAFAKVHAKRPAARLTFVGPDRGVNLNGRPWKLAEYVERLMPRAIETGVIRLEGQLTAEQVRHRRLNAHATLSCSRWENLSLALLEAMAAGCPVIAADAGGASEYIRDHVDGALFKAGDECALAETMLTFLDNPSLGQRLSAGALDCVACNFDPSMIATKRLRLYEHVLESRAVQVPA